jgi:AcrR family transcriptional regulator
MPRPAYSQDERAAIEARIRAAALELFGREGYRAVSLRAIAKAMGWSAPALYRYYDNKGALLAAIRAEGFRNIGRRLAAARADAESSLLAARAGMVAYLDFAREEPELFRLTYELDQGLVGEYSEVVGERALAFAEAEGLARDVLTETGVVGNPNQLAHLMWISVHGLATLALAQQLDMGQDFEALIEPVVHTLLRGTA